MAMPLPGSVGVHQKPDSGVNACAENGKSVSKARCLMGDPVAGALIEGNEGKSVAVNPC